MLIKEDVSNAIISYFIELVEKGRNEVDIVDANADIQRIIEKLDANPWNPVEESIPSDDRYVLLSFENFSLPVVGRYEESEKGGAFYCGDEEETLVSQDLFVNAWMELPERYKGK